MNFYGLLSPHLSPFLPLDQYPFSASFLNIFSFIVFHYCSPVVCRLTLNVTVSVDTVIRCPAETCSTTQHPPPQSGPKSRGVETWGQVRMEGTKSWGHLQNWFTKFCSLSKYSGQVAIRQSLCLPAQIFRHVHQLWHLAMVAVKQISATAVYFFWWGFTGSLFALQWLMHLLE